jgi:hypothetical protein|tara:strand:+ start:703 stop:1080 length:378 start_codon:yes stop_codon:yes gene_type:complete
MLKDKYAYLKDLMKNILNSYSIIESLSDGPSDLVSLQIELKKINGFLLVLSRKTTLLENNLANAKFLEKNIKLYFQNYEFSREIILLLDTYSEDSIRVRNIRDSVIKSLEDNSLIQKIYDISNEL